MHTIMSIDVSCGEFVDCVGKDMRSSLSQKLRNANVFSILFDGATDNSTKDQECFYVLLFDPHPTEKGKREKVELSLNLLGFRNFRACDGGSSADCIKFLKNTHFSVFDEILLHLYYL